MNDELYTSTNTIRHNAASEVIQRTEYGESSSVSHTSYQHLIGETSVEKVIALAKGTEPTPVISDGSSSNDKMCRICFGGIEDENTLGRLISPCHCKGTMRYVHLECLNHWRLRSQKKTSFFRCDECKYQYSFRRTAIAKFATNEFVLTLVTLGLFAFCVFVGGFFLKLYLYLNEYPASLVDLFSDELLDDETAEERPQLDPMNFSTIFIVDYTHLFFGFVFVAIIGFVQILFSLLWLGPFPSWSFRLPSGGGSSNGRGDNFAGAVIAIILVMGAIKAMWGMYQFVRGISRLILERVELVILEVNER